MTIELKQQASVIRKKILTMEWDLSQGQLHVAKVQRINSYKEQLKDLEAQIAVDPKKVSKVNQ
ncbi:hypothetical protein HOA92_00460 [archaeon]|jgi:hypothetical protein|nr:hypothetical protein [archaeon]MBT6761490.1 hypothetical protein [archaeon]